MKKFIIYKSIIKNGQTVRWALMVGYARTFTDMVAKAWKHYERYEGQQAYPQWDGDEFMGIVNIDPDKPIVQWDIEEATA